LSRLVFLFFIIFCASLNAQNYTYSYTDPCTKTLKTISVPMNGTVTVAYYGSIGVFSYNDFATGAFETWTNSVFSRFGGSNPCGSIVGNSTVATVTQGQVINTLGILNSLASIADVASGTTSMLGGSLNVISSTPTVEAKSSSTSTTSTSNSAPYKLSISLNKNSNGNSNNSVLGGSGSISSASTKPPSINVKISSPNQTSSTTTTKSSFTFSSKPGSGAVASNSGGKSEETPKVETPKEEGKTNITAGGTTTVKASSGSSSSNKSKSSSSKNGGKPVIVGSGDFVGFSFNDSEVSNGIKATGGYTSMRWDGKVSSGVMVDYTSAQIGPNITGFYALMGKNAVTLLSSTATISFAGAGSLYGTFAFGQMRSFKKVKPLKLVYMGTVSFGHVYKEMFLGTAVIGGGSYDLKVHKRLDLKFMGLAVFVPYMSYYQDVVVKSPIVLIPSLGANIGISKRFKLNVNIGSTVQSGSALNYTITTGTRLIL
jgi:hypothetical protein